MFEHVHHQHQMAGKVRRLVHEADRLAVLLLDMFALVIRIDADGFSGVGLVQQVAREESRAGADIEHTVDRRRTEQPQHGGSLGTIIPMPGDIAAENFCFFQVQVSWSADCRWVAGCCEPACADAG